MLKVLKKGCEPTKGSKNSACIDLYASEDIVIGAGETELVGLGVCIDMEELAKIARYHTLDNLPNNLEDCVYKEYVKSHSEFFYSTHYLQLMLRSSLSKHLVIANGVGVIDLDYKDEIKIRLHNPKSKADFSNMFIEDEKVDRYGNYHIKKGQKIAQATLLEHKAFLLGVETEDERSGGFGSTGE